MTDKPPETCPNCGADVPREAKACPECGSDEQTGWSERAVYDGLGLPDDEFDYDEFVKKEFGGEQTEQRRTNWMWWIVVAVLVVAMLFWLW